MQQAFGRHTTHITEGEILAADFLVPAPEDEKAGFSRRFRAVSEREESPVAVIGVPETRNLAMLLDKDDWKVLDPFVRTDMETYDFFLVRLCCSLHPVSEETALHSAEFGVALRQDGKKNAPLVYAMYPRLVSDIVRETSTMGLTGSLELVPMVGVTAGLEGTIETGVEYSRLVPKVTAHFDTGQSGGHWDLERTEVEELQGIRYFYLLVRAPKGFESLWVRFDLSAKVKYRGRWRDFFFTPERPEPATLEFDLLTGEKKVGRALLVA
ncbi:hypothetical protein J2129_001182 [Methanofollis sp. W23]|uniref:hypothetical protein n=1 Tax=Methanofollis sp. W23 TaxID=2817849 RepID=UPI001AE5201B|nr:hypothetical protein [Methanofollis sp. W23]MBP2145728.1 hypothetical protein [Methanofollis sp. W23]